MIDLALTVFPAFLVWNLRMKTKLKVAVAVLLGLSIFAAVASIVKSVLLKDIGKDGDVTYNLIPFIIWYT